MLEIHERKISRLKDEVANLLASGRYRRAAEKQEELCQFASRLEPRDVEALCGYFDALGEIRLRAGRPDAAREAWLGALQALHEELRHRCPHLLVGGEEPSVPPWSAVETRHRFIDEKLENARLLNRLAMLYHRTSSHQRARPLLERAMAITRTRLGVDHPDFAILLSNLASVEQGAGRFEGAETLYRQALDVLRTALGEEHREIAESQGELARLYRDWGRRNDALKWYERALETLRRLLGEEDPALVDVLLNMASIELETGDLTSAEWNLLRARRILRDPGSQDPLRESQALQNLSEVYRRMEDYERSENACRAALEIQVRLVPEDHPDCAVIINNLAFLCHRTGRLEEARSLYEKACRALRGASAEVAPRLLASLENLAALYRQAGEIEAAEELDQEMVRLRRPESGG